MPQNDEWLDELYAKGATDQPPPALDAEILAAAAQECVDSSTPAPAPRSRRYRGWATAAVVLLAAGILVDSQLRLDSSPASDMEVRRIATPEADLVPVARPTSPQEPQSAIAPEEAVLEEVVVTASRVQAVVPESQPPAPEAGRDSRARATETQLASRSAAPRQSADAGCTEVLSGGDYYACQASTVLRVQHPACSVPLVLANASLQASGTDGALVRQQERLFRAKCVEQRWVVEAQ